MGLTGTASQGQILRTVPTPSHTILVQTLSSLPRLWFLCPLCLSWCLFTPLTSSACWDLSGFLPGSEAVTKDAP